MDDLRLGVTDRCNFRCVYCMPAEGMEWLPRDEVLSYEELAYLAEILAGLGVHTFRITGGEPLVRKDVATLVRHIRSLGDHLDIALTTNGFLLERFAAELTEAGLNRVNVSIDTLRRDRFEEITRRDGLTAVMAGLAECERLGLAPIKINAVVMRDRNHDEVADFARWAQATGYEVRFIEFMPLDAQNEWSRANVVAAREMLDTLESEVGLVTPVDAGGPEPATMYDLLGGGRVGVIPSVTEPFCSTCNRLRITADGGFRTCLFALEELDVRAMVRSDVGRQAIEEALVDWVWGKEEGHRINEADFVRPAKSMSQIGG